METATQREWIGESAGELPSVPLGTHGATWELVPRPHGAPKL